LRRRRITLGIGIAAVVALAGCGSDSDDDGGDGDSTSPAALVEVLVEQGAPEDEAECVVEKLDGVTVDDLNEFFESIADNEPVEATEGLGEQFVNARVACEAGE